MKRAALTTVLFSFSTFDLDHTALNGTSTLVTAKSDFAGQPVLQRGSVTIADREGIINISRSLVCESRVGAREFTVSGSLNRGDICQKT